MSVALNGTWAPRTATQGTGVTTLDHTAETVAAGTNSALMATISHEVTVTSITANWDQLGTPQAMFLASSLTAATAAQARVYGLRAPTVGSGLTLRTSWTTAAQVAIDTVVFDNVIQTSDGIAFTNSNTATGAATKPTLTITSSAGDASVSAVVNDAFALGTIASPAVNIYAVNGSGDAEGGSYLLSTSTSDVHNWSAALAGNWGQCGIRVNQAPITNQPFYAIPIWPNGTMIVRKRVA
jgi:hypothetical protein